MRHTKYILNKQKRVALLTLALTMLISACSTQNTDIDTNLSTVDQHSESNTEDNTTTESTENDSNLEGDAMIYSNLAQDAQTALWENQWDEERGILNKDYPKRDDDMGYDYWWFAHAVDVMIDGYERTNDEVYLDRAIEIVEGEFKHNGNTLINRFYDDMEWMALALIRLHDHTQNQRYMDLAVRLFAEIKVGWTSVAGGGISWQKDKMWFKNTPANAPAVMLAARLYERTDDKEYADWAVKIFEWMHETLRNHSTGFIYDGINENQDGALVAHAKYTYNHGIYIGACIELYRMTEDTKYLSWAEETYQNATKVFTNSKGILNEIGEGDGGLFKGILVRYVALYYYALDEERSDIKDWLTINAESVAAKSINEAGMISDQWNGPAKEQQHMSSHLSGVMLFEVVAKLHTKSHEEFRYKPYK